MANPAWRIGASNGHAAPLRGPPMKRLALPVLLVIALAVVVAAAWYALDRGHRRRREGSRPSSVRCRHFRGSRSTARPTWCWSRARALGRRRGVRALPARHPDRGPRRHADDPELGAAALLVVPFRRRRANATDRRHVHESRGHLRRGLGEHPGRRIEGRPPRHLGDGCRDAAHWRARRQGVRLRRIRRDQGGRRRPRQPSSRSRSPVPGTTARRALRASRRESR